MSPIRPVLASLVASAFAHAAAAAPLQAGAGPISAERISAEVKELASDRYAGRAPGAPGEQLTVDHLVARFKALGLQPAGENGGWTQDVPLVRTQVKPGASVVVTTGAGRRALVQATDVYVNTVQGRDEVHVSAPLVFVGYGVKAPERGWDDFKGADLRGKILVFLVNDPDFEAAPGEPASGKFGGRAMTYYGRWTYKYEEAARQGAAGALIVHEAPGAGYGWVTVIAPQGENYDVAPGPGVPARVPFQGWLQRAAAVDLFRDAGLDLEALKRSARTPGFRPVPLHATLAVDLHVDHAEIRSRNVLAKIPGATRPAESVMVSAHWDAYGVGAPDATGDRIRHGAADDASGVAGLFEIARALKAGPPPARTVLFGAWTAEERGLLGSEWWGAHPTVSLPLMAANLTMDTLQEAGPARDVVLVGQGQSALDGLLADAARTQGRTVTPDSHPERGLFYRADHFSLAKRGVPVLLIMGLGGGPDLVDGGRAAGDRWVSDFTAHAYHQPGDRWTPGLDWRGAAQDVQALEIMTRRLASGREWPAWSAGSEFRGARDASAAQRR